MKTFGTFGAILLIIIAGIFLFQFCDFGGGGDAVQEGTAEMMFKGKKIDLSTAEIKDEKLRKELEAYVDKAIVASKSEGIDENTLDHQKLQEEYRELTQRFSRVENELELLKNESKLKEEKCEQITDPTEKAECEKDLDRLNKEVKEKEAELSDLQEAMKILSTLLKIAGYACAMAGQAQWAAGCFVAAGVLDQYVGEAAPGPTQEEAKQDSGVDIPEADQNENGDDINEVIKDSVPPDNRLVETLSNDGWKLAETGSKNGDWYIAQKGRLFSLWRGSEKKLDIDFFEKNTNASLPKIWETIRIDGTELTYVTEANETEALVSEDGLWKRRN